MALDNDMMDDNLALMVDIGNKITGADFKIEIEDCPFLSKLVSTATVKNEGRWAIEDIPGPGGHSHSQPGAKKSGESITLGFYDSVTGKAFDEVIKWVDDCIRAEGRKLINIYGFHYELGKSANDMEYTYCWPELDDTEWDYESKTTLQKMTLTVHYFQKRVKGGYDLSRD
jgi:hypothetical protein